MKYNKNYIGLTENDITKNFVIFEPKRNVIWVGLKLKKKDEIEEIINNSELNHNHMRHNGRRYKFRLKPEELANNKDVIIKLLKMAYEAYPGHSKIED